MILRLLTALIAFSAAVPMAHGQAGAGAPSTAPRSFLPEVRQIASEIAKRFNARVVVDPSLVPQAQPRNPAEAETIEAALDLLCRQVRAAAWRRVYLNQVQFNTLPAAEKLAETVRMMTRIEQTGVVVENPATRRASAFLRDYAVSPTFKDELAAQQFSTVPVYVIYRTTDQTAQEAAAESYADLQRKQFEMLSQMDPQTRAQALQQSIQAMMSADPQTRQQFLQFLQQARMMLFGGPGGPPGGPGGRRGPGGRGAGF